jgi:RNA polymerase sigma-70 factor (ECF subfamily)
MNDKLNGLSDTELAIRAKGGDAAAFEVIYDRHAAGVSRALVSFAGPDRDILDDLTQDVFLKVIRGLASYSASHPFSNWLFTIALNTGRNFARRRSKIVSVNPSELDSIAQPEEEGRSEIEKVSAAAIARMVAELPLGMRDVISLRVGSEMPYGEIAELLGIPEGTARSRMHNAIRILREKCETSGSRRRKHNERRL